MDTLLPQDTNKIAPDNTDAVLMALPVKEPEKTNQYHAKIFILICFVIVLMILIIYLYVDEGPCILNHVY